MISHAAAVRFGVKQKPTILRTPETVAEALEQAEAELQRPPSDATETLLLTPAHITTRAELFQPRGFANTGGLDSDHVAKLAKRIAAKGELDPPLVVKLGSKWVCVDGHHRVAAYLKQPKGGWKSTIRCDWFPGTVREAVDESLRRNEVIKLEMRRGDRFEAAWQRVVLEWGSKRDIHLLTGVSDGLLGLMRRVKTAHGMQDAFGKEFRRKVPSLKNATWSLARDAYLNITSAEYDERKEAANLARVLRDRLHGRLSENKKLTAMALAIYDPGLPEPLARHLRQASSALAGEDEGDLWDEAGPEPEAEPLTEELVEDLKRLRERQERTGFRLKSIEEELQRRGALPPVPSRSDQTWELWVSEEDKDANRGT